MKTAVDCLETLAQYTPNFIGWLRDQCLNETMFAPSPRPAASTRPGDTTTTGTGCTLAWLTCHPTTSPVSTVQRGKGRAGRTH